MKQAKYLLFVFLLLATFGTQAQVGIGTTTPAAKLDIRGSSSNPSIPGPTSTGVLRIGIAFNDGIDIGKSTTFPYPGWIQSGFNGTIADPLVLQPNGGAVGIGTTSPLSSAVLDLTSTTQGFLLPRMTAAQRTAITSPAEGLMVYQTDAPIGYYFHQGGVWLSWGTSTCSYSIGQNVAALGGFIFYLDASGCHGLVCATTNQSISIQWYNGTSAYTTAFASAVGAGWGNTAMIVFNQGAGSYAAKLCADLSSGGFTDWYLPSIYELNLMYTNIGGGAPAPNTNVGGFSSSLYWSSSESQAANAWGQSLTSGSQLSILKNLTYYVRAVRAF